jgi:hypothetical protein
MEVGSSNVLVELRFRSAKTMERSLSLYLKKELAEAEGEVAD